MGYTTHCENLCKEYRELSGLPQDYYGIGYIHIRCQHATSDHDAIYGLYETVSLGGGCRILHGLSGCRISVIVKWLKEQITLLKSAPGGVSPGKPLCSKT